MNQFFKVSIVFFLFLQLRCAVGPVNGLIYSDTRFAGEFNSANDVKYEKEGKSCLHNFFGLITLGSASAGRVAQNSGIKRIALIDHSTLNVFQILYGRYCTHVYGE